MAEAIWRTLGSRVPGSSAGVSAWSGQPAAQEAQAVVKKFGADLSGHRSRDIREINEKPAWIFTMTSAQAAAVTAVRPEWADRVRRLSDFVGESGDISDPIGLDVQAYEALADHLHNLLVRLKDKLERKNEEETSCG